MYDFKKHLLPNEKILYEGRPNPGKGKKDIAGSIFIILFAIFGITIFILALIDKVGEASNGLNFKFIYGFIVFIAIIIGAVKAIHYQISRKKKEIEDDYYCLTNQRAMIYETNTQKLSFGYLSEYGDMYIRNEKDNYGDLIMEIHIDSNLSNEERQVILNEKVFNENLESSPGIDFKSIYQPAVVLRMALEARDNLLKNKNK